MGVGGSGWGCGGILGGGLWGILGPWRRIRPEVQGFGVFSGAGAIMLGFMQASR